MKLFLQSAIFVLLTSSLSYGQSSASSYKNTSSRQPLLATPTMYLAPQMGTEILLGYSRTNSQMEVEGQNSEMSDNLTRASLAQAITRNFFLGVNATYNSAVGTMEAGYKSNFRQEGVREPSLGFGARMDWQKISLLSQLHYEFDSGNASLEVSNNGDISQSAKSGGSSVTPSLGLFSNHRDSFLLGMDISYRIRQERIRNLKIPILNVNGITRTAGGNVLGVTFMVESPQATHSLGASATYLKTEKSIENYADMGLTRTSTDLEGNENAILSGYGNFLIGSSVSIQPAVSYSHYLNNRVGGIEIEKQNTMSYSLTGKVRF